LFLFKTHNSVELQLASVYCVSNLVCSNEEGASERQSKLKEMGVQKILQKLLQSVDPILFDKVKLTLQQFSSSSLQSLSSSSSSSTSSLINSGSTTNLH
jgi:cytochrome c556